MLGRSSKMWLDGSSPLARGLPPRRTPDHGADRIIPARAGFTEQDVADLSADADHPRSRGVYPHSLGAAAYPVGSSPLARGLLRGGGFPGHPRGIIPARAGFTSRLRAHPPGDQDHPRSRGVYVWGLESDAAAAGSSPLARGLLQGGCRRAACHRIIPARAGFTLLVPLYTPAGGDHPRSRGVYGGAAASAIMGGGSSPLARGLRDRRRAHLLMCWIIPARAGFTPWTRNVSGSKADHPRSRGVYAHLGRAGSWAAWIIPARAGFTVLASGSAKKWPGSSPLARGLPLPPV